MGIFHQGVRIHHVAPQRLDGPHLLDFEFPWSKVGRLFFAVSNYVAVTNVMVRAATFY